MWIYMAKENIKIESPSEYAPWNVMYWEPDSQKLVRQKQDGSKEAATLLHKAQIFIEKECIDQTDAGWICKPLSGYNKTTYKINSDFKCNCQGFNKNNYCSHVLAVKQFIFLRSKNGR